MVGDRGSGTGAGANSLAAVGWPLDRLAAEFAAAVRRQGGTWLTDDAGAVVGCPDIELVVEATGDALAGAAHALAAIEAGKHVVMVNVEADVLAGPALARKARAQGVVYSLAYGDQPALIAEMVDWARACGLRGGRRRQGHQIPAGLPSRRRPTRSGSITG